MHQFKFHPGPTIDHRDYAHVVSITYDPTYIETVKMKIEPKLPMKTRHNEITVYKR